MKRLWLACCLGVAMIAAVGAGEAVGPRGLPGAAPAPESPAAPAAEPSGVPVPPPSLALGLAWLAKTQEEDGSWDASKYQGKAEPEAVTALAMLAFIGDRSNSKSGRYTKNVRAANAWLASRYAPRTRRIGPHRLAAPLALMALADDCACSEIAAMRPLVQKLTDYAVATQNEDGGWGDAPSPATKAAAVNPVATGWWVLALASAKVAGAEVSDDCWGNAAQHVTAIVNEGIVNGANAPRDDRHADLAAVGLACLPYLGKERDDPNLKGCAEALVRNEWIMGQSHGYDGVADGGKTNYLGWYFQVKGLYWYGTRSEPWLTMERRFDAILANLQEKEGPDAGSWPADHGRDGPGGFEATVGRVGVTAIACMMIEEFWWGVSLRAVFHPEFSGDNK